MTRALVCAIPCAAARQGSPPRGAGTLACAGLVSSSAQKFAAKMAALHERGGRWFEANERHRGKKLCRARYIVPLRKPVAPRDRAEWAASRQEIVPGVAVLRPYGNWREALVEPASVLPESTDLPSAPQRGLGSPSLRRPGAPFFVPLRRTAESSTEDLDGDGGAAAENLASDESAPSAHLFRAQQFA